VLLTFFFFLNQIKINVWSVSDSDKITVSQVESLVNSESRCDCIQWNCNVENILASVSLGALYLWDVETKAIVNCKCVYMSPTISIYLLFCACMCMCVFEAFRGHGDAIQSISWKRDGSLLVTTSKDKTMQIFDPRNQTLVSLKG
jgi:WD40 repeat protein